MDNQPRFIDALFEQEEFEERQGKFMEFAQFNDQLKQKREEDYYNRYEEKIRQLSEYIDLQGKINDTRRSMYEPREAFRQRYIEVERKRLTELAAQEKKLIDEEKAKAELTKQTTKKRSTSGKKRKT